jgi:hypothetical protein
MLLSDFPLDILLYIFYKCQYKSIQNIKHSCIDFCIIIDSSIFWKKKLIENKGILFSQNIVVLFPKITWEEYNKNIDNFEEKCKNINYPIWSNDCYFKYWKVLYTL